MAQTVNIITPNTGAIDMRLNEFFLSDQRGHFARNLSFDENKIQTRPSINYDKINLTGEFIDATYHDPKQGLNALSVTANAPEQLVIVTTTGVWSVVINDLSVNKIWSATYVNGYVYSAENYAIVVAEGNNTIWINHNNEVTQSKGTDLLNCDDGVSHDNLVDSQFRHYIPNNATVGAYIHGRNHVSTTHNVANSVISVSDILNKRQCPENTDILLWEEQAAFSDLIGAPSSLGKTVALATLRVGSVNGEGELFDFRECGVIRHNTLSERETRYADGDNGLTKNVDGWDNKRISNVTFTSVTATGIRAVTELPLDILFRSEYGLHFLKVVLGEGTFNDQTTNTISQDVEPLLNSDKRLDKAIVGHWKFGNRFFATTGINDSGVTNAFVSANQGLTFTEDRTPRFGWEGAWQLDEGIYNLDAFIKKGKTRNDFALIATDEYSGIYIGSFGNKCGYDVRDGITIPIDSTYISGYFAMNGLSNDDIVTNGAIDAIINSSTKSVTVSIRTNINEEWQTWKHWNINEKGYGSLSDTFERPPENSTEGSFFQFKIDAVGYIRIIGMTVDFKAGQKRNTLKSGITPINCQFHKYLR